MFRTNPFVVLWKGKGGNGRFLADGKMFHVRDDDFVTLYHRTRPEPWYGIFHLKEMWATLLLSLALLWSLHRDWKGLARGGRREGVDA